MADAMEIRRGVLAEHAGIVAVDRLVKPIIAQRRAEPRNDLISVLVQAELADDETGQTHRLTDDEVFIFSFLLLAAGSGTTWKQLGIIMLMLLRDPRWLDRVKDDPDFLGAFIEETMRWMPTDPFFSRFATQDTSLHGVDIPAGSVVHLCFASANRDPDRWERPDDFDPERKQLPHMGFGAGSHVCLGQHVARAEIREAIGALVTRLPGLRLDPAAEAPRITGLYERGPTALPVLWDHI
ncbi:cytochrome P450 [Gordonia amarae]|nr:cytochrome P450 [Gordonia amarae]MCS3877636.1 cytochrome P450 [Gordonia amarae]GAB05945.1 putative cytochrome P450 [Gordonia amarae NBRC 15530]